MKDTLLYLLRARRMPDDCMGLERHARRSIVESVLTLLILTALLHCLPPGTWADPIVGGFAFLVSCLLFAVIMAGSWRKYSHCRLQWSALPQHYGRNEVKMFCPSCRRIALRYVKVLLVAALLPLAASAHDQCRMTGEEWKPASDIVRIDEFPGDNGHLERWTWQQTREGLRCTIREAATGRVLRIFVFTLPL